jgi:hypothetical protein
MVNGEYNNVMLLYYKRTKNLLSLDIPKKYKILNFGEIISLKNSTKKDFINNLDL